MHREYREITRHWQFIVSIGLIAAVLAFGATILFPLKYRADTQVFIISKTRAGVDPYTVVKSAERVGENLVEVLKTDDFRAKVRAIPGYQLDWNSFDTLTDRDRRKLWTRIISGSVVYGTGMMNIHSYHKDPDMAKQFAGAVAQTLSADAWEYVGGDVIIKIVNSPIATRWPVKPNILVNTVLGFVAGVLLAVLLASRSRV